MTCKINYSVRLIKITYMLRNDKNKEVPVSDTEKARLLKTFSAIFLKTFSPNHLNRFHKILLTAETAFLFKMLKYNIWLYAKRLHYYKC